MGSFLFVLAQQLIIVDIAYNWNSSWIEKADQAELAEGIGKGKKWLIAILVSCAILYSCSLAGIIAMYIHFGGCASSDAFISITLVMSFLCTVLQLTKSETSSLLTSACMTLYATYLCGSAISQNPNSECNSFLGVKSTWNIVLGLAMAFISLTWTGWSYTTDEHLGGGNDAVDDHAGSDKDKPKVRGVVLNNEPSNESSPLPEASNQESKSFGSSWKLNAVLATVCCWYAMVLTGWGAIQKRGDIANPQAGDVSMWMLISSQWIALLLYFWTLLAPTLFPDRDFS